MNLILTAEHAFVTSAKDVVSLSKFVMQHVLPALKTAKADEATVEAITALVSPQAASVERLAFAVLGSVIAALDSAHAVNAQGGLDLTLDAQLVSDLKTVAATVKLAAAGSLPVEPVKVV